MLLYVVIAAMMELYSLASRVYLCVHSSMNSALSKHTVTRSRVPIVARFQPEKFIDIFYPRRAMNQKGQGAVISRRIANSSK